MFSFVSRWRFWFFIWRYRRKVCFLFSFGLWCVGLVFRGFFYVVLFVIGNREGGNCVVCLYVWMYFWKCSRYFWRGVECDCRVNENVFNLFRGECDGYRQWWYHVMWFVSWCVFWIKWCVGMFRRRWNGWDCLVR